MSKVNKYILSLFSFIIIILVIVHIHIGAKKKPFYLRATPPESVKTLKSYLEWRPETKTIFKIENDGNIYYFCLGEQGPMPASGPSAYCFDSESNFLGWSADIGDLRGTLPQQAYEKRYNWTELKVEEVSK